ncbi:MAG: hypothetical protein AKCLJLPJ_00417 [Fimbriimonadales bacterium]|nr:hypothetical protein [Fimbriimonadales bacterium]
MKHFACILALSLLSLAAAQPELSQPKPGPYSIKGNKAWSIFVENGAPFVVDADPFGRTAVITGLSCRIDVNISGEWRPFYAGSNLYNFCRPGMILPVGTYRATTNSGFPGHIWGYMAPHSSMAYSGSDEYPPSDKIWMAHVTFNREFTVPAGVVYMITYTSGDSLDRFDSAVNAWVPYLQGSGDLRDTLGPPGIRIPPGLYRFRTVGGASYVGGFITTEY